MVLVSAAPQWGDVPTWIGSLLTGGSLLLAVSILWRDRQAEIRRQAMAVACWADFKNPRGSLSEHIAAEARGEQLPDGYTYTVHIENLSQMPIARPTIYRGTLSKSEVRRRRRLEGFGRHLGPRRARDHVDEIVNLGEDGVVLSSLRPGESIERTLIIKAPPSDYLVVVHFGDATGRFWAKDVRYGTLYAADRWLFLMG
jgi:hypothetical protein